MRFFQSTQEATWHSGFTYYPTFPHCPGWPGWLSCSTLETQGLLRQLRVLTELQLPSETLHQGPGSKVDHLDKVVGNSTTSSSWIEEKTWLGWRNKERDRFFPPTSLCFNTGSFLLLEETLNFCQTALSGTISERNPNMYTHHQQHKGLKAGEKSLLSVPLHLKCPLRTHRLEG